MRNLLFLFLLSLSIPAFAQTADSSQYFYQKGMEEKAAKRWLVASGYFTKSTYLNPRDTAAYIENGNVNLEMHNLDVAIRNFSKANELDPANTDVIKNLVTLYFNYHLYKKSLDLAVKCTTCGNLDKTIALCYYNLEDLPSAEKLLLKIVPKNPTDAQLTYTLGKLYSDMELNAKAIPFYLKAIALDTNKTNWLYEVGMLYYMTNNYKNAVVYFNKAKDHGFTVTMDFNDNLGHAYIYSGEFEKGEKLLLEIIAKKRGDKDLLRDMAFIYYKFKLYDDALNYYQKLMELDMKDAKALYAAGLCFQRKGDKERGEQMCDRAIELDPTLRSLKTKIEVPGGL